jgi:hypothetical protein
MSGGYILSGIMGQRRLPKKLLRYHYFETTLEGVLLLAKSNNCFQHLGRSVIHLSDFVFIETKDDA